MNGVEWRPPAADCPQLPDVRRGAPATNTGTAARTHARPQSCSPAAQQFTDTRVQARACSGPGSGTGTGTGTRTEHDQTNGGAAGAGGLTGIFWTGKRASRQAARRAGGQGARCKLRRRSKRRGGGRQHDPASVSGGGRAAMTCTAKVFRCFDPLRCALLHQRMSAGRRLPET